MQYRLILLLLASTLGGCATQGTLSKDSPLSASTDISETDNSSLMLLADDAFRKGNYKHAEQVYRTILSEDPQSVVAQRRLGNTLAKQKRFDEAIEYYKVSLKNDNSTMQAYNNLATLYLYQAQQVLSSGIETLPADKGDTAQIKHMLWQLKKITPSRLEDANKN